MSSCFTAVIVAVYLVLVGVFKDGLKASSKIRIFRNGRLGLHGAEHLKCYHMVTLGFEGIN